MSQQSDLRSFFNKGFKKPVDPEPSPSTSLTESGQSSSVQKKPRKFCSDWLGKYKWLRYDNDLMFCDVCMSAKDSVNPFTEGCNNFQNSTLTRHQDSKAHVTSLKLLNMKSNFSKACSSATSQKELENSDKINSYAMQIRTVYVMCKRDLPADTFTDLMHLQTLNGLKCNYFKSPQIVSEYEQIIEKSLADGLIQDINNSEYVGIMLDETCDISVNKKLAIYIKYLKNGEAFVAFLGNEKITDSTAGGIETALINFLVRKGITDENLEKVLGLGTDGAAVMTGRLNGLGARLKRTNKNLTQVHCVAHRLNLAASQAGRGIDYCKKYHEMIHCLYKFYADSSVRYDRLRELQEILHGRASQMTEPTSVRWLSVESAVKSIYASYAPIYQSLESEKSSGKADGLLRFLSNVKFLLFTALLVDVLVVIEVLSLTFQKDSVNVSHIRQNVNSTKETLTSMITGSNTVTQVLNELGEVVQGQKSNFKGLDVTDSQQLRNEFINLRRSYIQKLLENLTSRFPEDELQTLESLDILINPKRYPDDNATLSNYGDEQLNLILEFYSDYIDADRTRAHFLLFKHFAKSQKALPFDRFTKLLITEFHEQYPDFVVLAKIALIIPVSSAPCERGFSVQNAIKNKIRNRLNPERLNRLMFIKLQGPNVEQFDVIQAARTFAYGAEGRL